MTGLRPFFGYFGSKWQLAPRYPAPAQPTIVEPFAGAAGYSTRWPDRRVVLCDLDPVVAGLWQYLIRASEAEVLAIPDLPEGGTVADMGLPQEQAWLVGFWVNRGQVAPRNRPSRWMRDYRGMPRYDGNFWGPQVRERVARQLAAIRHWEAHCCDYRDCPVAGRATRFVDPPYQETGGRYTYGTDCLDHAELGRWCRRQEGLTIACEAEGADWLPFRPVGTMKTQSRNGKRRAEVAWAQSN